MSDKISMPNKVINALIWGLTLIVAVLIGLGIHHFIATSNNVTQKEISFVVEDENGKEVELDDFKGKPIVVNFWAIWCGPCKAELPAFQNVYNDYKNEVDFLFINVNKWNNDSPQDVKAFMKENGYSFPVYYDTQRNAEEVCGVEGVPFTLFIDEDGKVARSYSGSMSELLLRSYIKQLLN